MILRVSILIIYIYIYIYTYETKDTILMKGFNQGFVST
jgi:hypothetical protein